MFAARFDPKNFHSYGSGETESKTKSFSIPQKRTRSSDVDSSSEDDREEEEDNAQEAQKDETDNTDVDAVAKQAIDFSSTGSELTSNVEERVSDMSSGEKNLSDDAPVKGSEKHSSLMRRFQQTLSLQEELNQEEDSDGAGSDTDLETVHDLTPIPQPKKVKDVSLKRVDIVQHKTIAWNSVSKFIYDNNMVKDFDEYKDLLDERLLANIQKTYSTKTFPIQTIIFDTILQPLNFSSTINKSRFTRYIGDILVNASTGSGKTLAYSVPILQCLKTRVVNRLRALIIVPTKILIHQVYECLSTLNEGSYLHIAMSKLENSMKEEHAKFSQNCPDILIITPGRLVDHLQMGSFNLRSLKFLVLDEADRLLNQSFQNWNQILLSHIKADKDDNLPGNVIKMVFSATLTTNTEKMHNLQLHNPKVFVRDNIKLFSMPKKLQEFNVPIPTSKSVLKPLLLLKILEELTCSSKSEKILVFVKSNEASIRLAALLQIMRTKKVVPGLSFNVSSINSNNTNGENKRLIQEFSDSNEVKSILVSTDLMSRGIDINEISHVINYDLPVSSRQYVHRCGRTARANMSGVAINLLVGKGERTFWSDSINVDLSRDVDGHEPELFKEDEDLREFYSIDDDLNSLYSSCLAELKQRVTTK